MRMGGGAEGEEERENLKLKQTLHWVGSLMQGSISQPWSHDLSQSQGVGRLTDWATHVSPFCVI